MKRDNGVREQAICILFWKLFALLFCGSYKAKAGTRIRYKIFMISSSRLVVIPQWGFIDYDSCRRSRKRRKLTKRHSAAIKARKTFASFARVMESLVEDYEILRWGRKESFNLEVLIDENNIAHLKISVRLTQIPPIPSISAELLNFYHNNKYLISSKWSEKCLLHASQSNPPKSTRGSRICPSPRSSPKSSVKEKYEKPSASSSPPFRKKREKKAINDA